LASLAPNAGKKLELTLDPATFLLVKNSAISISDTGQPIAQEMRLEKWTAVEGIRFPHRSINIHDGVKRAEITVESMKVSSGMNPADLALKASQSCSCDGREPHVEQVHPQ
jgi:hypothetical protein